MTSKADVRDFLAQKSFAIVGVSRKGNKFGNAIYKELKAKGYKVFPVNPHTDKINDEPCFPDLASLPEQVDGAVIVVPPLETEKVVKDAAQAGIQRIWIQQGAVSEQAVRFCSENEVNVISGECILMFAEPAAFYHKIHRFVWRLLGKLPR